MHKIHYAFAKWDELKDKSAEALIGWNIYFNDFLIEYRWYVFLIWGFLVTLCTLCTLVRDHKRNLASKKRRQKLIRGRKRLAHTTQQRWPGAANHNHEISRNAQPNPAEFVDNVDVVHKRPYMLIRSHSGIIYGCYEDGGKTKLNQLLNCNCFAKEK